MSPNYRFYVEKARELRQARAQRRPLRLMLEELLDVVRRCEADWKLDDHVRRDRR